MDTTASFRSSIENIHTGACSAATFATWSPPLSAVGSTHATTIPTRRESQFAIREKRWLHVPIRQQKGSTSHREVSPYRRRKRRPHNRIPGIFHSLPLSFIPSHLLSGEIRYALPYCSGWPYLKPLKAWASSVLIITYLQVRSPLLRERMDNRNKPKKPPGSKGYHNGAVYKPPP